MTDPVQGVPIEPRAIIAEWHGDRVTVWSSTQVPYAARAGVAHTLQIPESHVRVDRPAPRRRLRRQVRLPLRGPRRGARARRRTAGEARLLPPRGVLRGRPPARGDGDRARDRRPRGRHARRAARPARARQRAPTAARAASSRRWRRCTRSARTRSRTSDIESSLIYSNNQPSSSIRAPTAPQVCWALEQHMDELAEALGIDPVELRRRTLIEEGSVTATGPGARADRDEGDARAGGRADRLRRRSCPTDEAIGVACGWWPCFAGERRRVRQAQPATGRARSSRARRRTARAR